MLTIFATLLLQGQPLTPEKQEPVANYQMERVALASKELITGAKGNYYYV